MNQTMMTLTMASGIASLFLSTVCLILSCTALAVVYGLKNSTHKLIQGPWSQVQPQKDEYINSDDLNDDSPVSDDDEIQDLPIGMRPSKPQTIMDQMSEHMYPDVSKEQV